MRRTNYWAVVIAAVAAFVMSSVWYIGFGDVLAKQSALYANAQALSVWEVVAEFGRGLAVAYVFARLAMWLGIASWRGSVRLGAWLWAFPALILSGSVLHEGYPWIMAAIHAGDWLVKLLLMALIIGAWRKKQADPSA
jgi:hypothetical protein